MLWKQKSKVRILCFLFSRPVLTGRGAAGAGSLPRLQQAHPTGAEHDAEGGGGLRTGFHSAHQCGESEARKSASGFSLSPSFVTTTVRLLNNEFH